jgi:hypothetical protein
MTREQSSDCVEQAVGTAWNYAASCASTLPGAVSPERVPFSATAE